MKPLSLMILALALASSSMVRAQKIDCIEPETDALAKHRKQYRVTLTSLEKITDPAIVGEHDSAERVSVLIRTRDPRYAKSQFATLGFPFRSIATKDDVLYQIDNKAYGFSIHIYLDEMNETSARFRRVEGEVRLLCK